MNLLVFTSFHLPPHFVAINMEIIQQNIDAGHNVTVLDCRSSFSGCGFNPYKLKYMCEICKFRESDGLKLIQGNYKRLSIKDIISREDENKADIFLDKIQLIDKDLTFENFDVGESVLSSHISKTREREFNNEDDQKILRELTSNSIITYLSIRRFIHEENIEKVSLFNGRWDYYRAALSAARIENLDVEIFEKFRYGGYYENYGNYLPHDIGNKNDLINRNWDKNGNLEAKIKIADDFFIRKKKGHEVADKSYTKNQIKGKLPVSYDENKKTFVLYNSSDDEFAAVGKIYKNPFFEDQLEGILYLVDYFKEKEDSQLIIRMHPNLSGLTRDYLNPLYDLENKNPNIILIKPEADIDTYGLMDAANVIISFGSTAGVEASYWGKPVVLLGKCFYFDSKIAHVPKSKADIPELLESELQPMDRLAARKFGYYILTGGIKGDYYYSDENKNYFFKGKHLNPLPAWFRLKYGILKFLNVKN